MCATGSSAHDVFAALYASTVTISDPVPPTISSLGGSITAPPPSTFHSTSDTMTFSASDNVGIAHTTVYVDGQPRSTLPNPCDYTFVVPCLQAPNVTHTLDWPALGLVDGPHQVQGAATDAAGNETRGAAVTVLVDTHAPTPPIGLPASVVQTRSPSFTLAWTDPPQGQAAPIARADYLLCSASTPSHCLTGAVSDPNVNRLTITVPALGRWRVEIWLADAAGNGLPTNAAASQLAYLAPTGLRLGRPSLRGRHLTATGTIGLQTGSVAAALRLRRHGRLAVLHGSASIRQGHFRLTLVLARGAEPVRGGRLVVTTAGDATHAPARATARL